MSSYPLFLPMFIQIGLTTAIGFYLGFMRVRALKKIGMRGVRDHGWPKKTAQAGANFINQFEVPVMFYALCISLTIMGDESRLAIIAAWIFVIARILHASVQLTNDKIFPNRFGLFLISGLAGTILFFEAMRRLMAL